MEQKCKNKHLQGRQRCTYSRIRASGTPVFKRYEHSTHAPVVVSLPRDFVTQNLFYSFQLHKMCSCNAANGKIITIIIIIFALGS